MVLEFVLAIASGVIVTLVSSYIQSKNKPPDAIFEITRRSEWTVQRAVFQDGEIIQEETETRIEESTFRIPQPSPILTDRRIPFGAGVAVILLLLLLLLVV